MTYKSTKTYGHEVGLSCAFRQWKAESHCARLHGYALSVKIEFEASELSPEGWVMDFGDLGAVKQALVHNFDHRTVVAVDDPQLDWFQEAQRIGILDLIVLEAVGCEAFAKFIHREVAQWLAFAEGTRVKVTSVEVREHGANSAIYQP